MSMPAMLIQVWTASVYSRVATNFFLSNTLRDLPQANQLLFEKQRKTQSL